MDLIQSRQERSFATAVMLLTVAACGMFYVFVPPRPPAVAAGYHLDRTPSFGQTEQERR